MGGLIKFVIGLNITSVKKVVLQTVLIIILEKSKLIHNLLPIEKILTFHNVMILIKSIVYKDKKTTTITYS